MAVLVNSDNVRYTDAFIEADYSYHTTKVAKKEDQFVVTPQTDTLNIRTRRQVPKVGVMLVGWGGNNGSTFTAALLANKHQLSWSTKQGRQQANWYGSITQASTIRMGTDEDDKDVYIPFNSILPMVHPNNLEIDGWDISGANLAEACERAQVLEPLLQEKLKPFLEKLKPRPSIYDPDFIAANQEDRANNIVLGSKRDQVQQICNDIEDFRKRSCLDHVIVVWTANTERFSTIIANVNDSADNIEKAVDNNYSEISPSTLFAYASILMKCTYLNGSPQNTFVPGIIDLAQKRNVFISGDDFKSGQTKIKSVLVDFLISAGIKPVSIVSYNHLGNNDGKNLSAPSQFRSKEISKSNVVDDMVNSNKILYSENEQPDHCVVIKYVPYVGDSKRAMDEYVSQIMMGGHNTLVLHNTCEDSLLAAPIILDLVILAELCFRIEFKKVEETEYSSFHPILSILGYLCKAPLVPKGIPIVNSLFRQRYSIENILRACLGLPPESHMLLEHKISALMGHRTCTE